MFTPGLVQMVICLAIGLLFFGNRLPSTMRSLGMSIKSFKEGMHETNETEEEVAAK